MSVEYDISKHNPPVLRDSIRFTMEYVYAYMGINLVAETDTGTRPVKNLMVFVNAEYKPTHDVNDLMVQITGVCAYLTDEDETYRCTQSLGNDAAIIDLTQASWKKILKPLFNTFPVDLKEYGRARFLTYDSKVAVDAFTVQHHPNAVKALCAITAS